MNTDYERFDNPYDACVFLDTLKEEQVIGITSTFGNFYVFYRKE